MLNNRFLALVLAFAAMVGLASNALAAAAQEGPIALSGVVSSQEDGPMEGVLVTAKKTGSTIATTVVSDVRGRYRFPASRLEPGSYAIRIKAAGWEFEGPPPAPAAIALVPVKAPSVPVTVGAKTTTFDIKLRKANRNEIASQLSNSEWLMSFPGTDAQKAAIQGCTHCHTYERIVRSKHTVAEWKMVIDRMRKHTPESFPGLIQPHTQGGRIGQGEETPEQRERAQRNEEQNAEYLATLNLSSGPDLPYNFNIARRPAGKQTQVIVTEYDLPRPINQPHDVVVDSKGMVWWASFGEPVLGKLDPKTGKNTEYKVPVLKPGYVVGTLALELDKQDNLWLAMTFQGAISKFDQKTEQFQVFNLPPELNGDYREITFVAPQHSDVDGKVWINDSGTYTQLRLDIATGKWETFETSKVPRPNTYQMASDTENNGIFTVFGREDIGKIDAKTGKVTFYKTPTPRSGPRRGQMDAQDNFWFVENRANKIGVLDFKTGRFKEWTSPNPQFWPYDLAPGKNGEVWVVTEYSDSVMRFNPKTAQWIEYFLPRETNQRRAAVDEVNSPGALWVGNTHQAGIVKVEPMDQPTD